MHKCLIFLWRKQLKFSTFPLSNASLRISSLTTPGRTSKFDALKCFQSMKDSIALCQTVWLQSYIKLINNAQPNLNTPSRNGVCDRSRLVLKSLLRIGSRYSRCPAASRSRQNAFNPNDIELD